MEMDIEKKSLRFATMTVAAAWPAALTHEQPRQPSARTPTPASTGEVLAISSGADGLSAPPQLRSTIRAAGKISQRNPMNARRNPYNFANCRPAAGNDLAFAARKQ